MSEGPGPVPPPPPPPLPGFGGALAKKFSEKQKQARTTQPLREKLTNYTTSAYREINPYLRARHGIGEVDKDKVGRFEEDHDMPVDQYVEGIVGDLQTMPQYPGEEVYRGVGLGPDGGVKPYVADPSEPSPADITEFREYHGGGIIGNYEPGKIVVDHGFMSTTFGQPFAQDTILVLTLPEQHTGRDITSISAKPAEKEVLFPPGTSYRITDKVRKGEPGFYEALTKCVPDERERDENYAKVSWIVFATVQPPAPQATE